MKKLYRLAICFFSVIIIAFLEKVSVFATETNLDKYISNYNSINKIDYTKQSYKAFIILSCVIIIVFLISITLFILKSMNVIFKKDKPHFVMAKFPEDVCNDDSNKSDGITTYGLSGEDTLELGRLDEDEDGEGTVVLNASFESSNQAKLVRTSNSESISIDEISFIIGKDPVNANYSVKDNPSISRMHARISFNGNKYYICDLDSTNFSYVNNHILSPDNEVELKDGDVIRLSNEEFIFKNE